MFATLGWKGRLKIWELGSGRLLFQTPIPDPHIGYLFWGPEDRLSVYFPGSLRGTSRQLSRALASRVYRTWTSGAAVQGAEYQSRAVSPDGRITAIGTSHGVSLIDSATGKVRHFLPHSALPIFDAEGALVVRGPQGSVRWPVRADPDDPGILRLGPSEPFPTPFDHLSGSLDQSGDLSTLAMTLARGGVRVWRLGAPQEVKQLYHDGPEDDDCRQAFLSHDARLIATTSHKSNRHIKIRDVATGRLLHTLHDPVGISQGVVFSADGRFLASTAGHCREIGTWAERTPPPVGQCADFSPDSRTLAVGRKDGTIHLFDVLTGRVFAVLDDPFQDEPQDLTFNPDGSQLLVTSGVNRCVHVWDLRELRRELAALGLDWDLPPLPEPEANSSVPVRRMDGPARRDGAGALPAGLTHDG